MPAARVLDGRERCFSWLPVAEVHDTKPARTGVALDGDGNRLERTRRSDAEAVELDDRVAGAKTGQRGGGVRVNGAHEREGARGALGELRFARECVVREQLLLDGLHQRGVVVLQACESARRVRDS